MNGGILKANNQLVLDLNGRSEKLCCCEKCPLDQLSGQCMHANSICTFTA